MWTLMTLICPASIVEQARNIGDCLHPAASGMFTTPLRPVGHAGDATHYASSGLIEPLWIPALYDADVLYASAQAGSAAQGIVLTATHADCALLLTGDISEDPWDVACARLGLEPIFSGEL